MTGDPIRLGRGGCCGFLILGMVFGFCLLLDTCVSRVEVMRVTTPDQGLTATVTETNGGATTDFGYDVAVARNWPVGWGAQVANLYGATRSDCAYGVTVRWIDNDTLSIEYKEAKYADTIGKTSILGRPVRIVAKSGVSDPTAPCGGMEYNQRR